MEPVTFEQQNQFVDMKKVRIGEIPCLIFRPRDEKTVYPTVIYYHGWSSCKDYQVFKGEVLASYGFQVIIPDAIHHGERDAVPHWEEGMMEKYFRKVLLRSVEEAGKILEYIREELPVDPDRIAVMGHSMGGFISSGVFGNHRELKTAIVLNGSCAWSVVEESMEKTWDDEVLTPEEEQRLRDYDPYHHMDHLEGRPLLLIHGENDTVMPIDSQEVYYQKLEEVYREHPEHIRFVRVPRMDHYISTGMMEECIVWLKKHL